MATSKPIKKAPTKTDKPKRVYKPRVKKVEVIDYVKEEVAPVVKRDWKKLSNLPDWGKYALLIALAIAIGIIIKNFFDGRKVAKNNEKVKVLEEQTKQKEKSIDSLKSLLLEYDAALQADYSEANKATEERKQSEREGEVKKKEIKHQTDETIKRFKDPALSADDRLRIIREQLKRSAESRSNNELP